MNAARVSHAVGGLRDENGVRCSSDDETTDRRASRTRTWSVHRRAVARRPHSFAKQPYPPMSRPRCFYLDRNDHEHCRGIVLSLLLENVERVEFADIDRRVNREPRPSCVRLCCRGRVGRKPIVWRAPRRWTRRCSRSLATVDRRERAPTSLSTSANHSWERWLRVVARPMTRRPTAMPPEHGRGQCTGVLSRDDRIASRNNLAHR